MATIDVGAAVGSGFGLIRRRPGAVLLWGLAHLVAMLMFYAIMGPAYLKMFNSMQAFGLQQSTSPEASQAMMAQMMSFEGPAMLMGLLVGFVGIVVNCAVFRAVIHPEESRFGYLRVGLPELFLYVLLFGFEFAFVFAILIGALIVGIVVAILSLASAKAVAVLVAVLAGLSAGVAFLWVILRFSMAGPMMVADKQFRLMESWTLTKGHAVELFLIALCLFGILVALETVVLGLFFTVVAAGVMSAASGGAGLHAFAGASPGSLFSVLAPWLVVGGLLWIPFAGCFAAIIAAPWARAYLDLSHPAVTEGALAA